MYQYFNREQEGPENAGIEVGEELLVVVKDNKAKTEGDFIPPLAKSGKLKVNLVYKGKSEPIPEESPWVEEDGGSG